MNSSGFNAGGEMEAVEEVKNEEVKNGEVENQTQHLTFLLAGEEFAIGILQVREIIKYDTLTKVPMVPAYIRGVINLRGSVVPVVDLAVKFGLPESPVTKQSCIVIVETALEGERTVMGVVADSVKQVIDLAPADIEAAPLFGTKVRVDFLHGLGKAGKKFVLILDIDRILTVEELGEIGSVKKDLQDEAPASGPRGAAREEGSGP
jgi:purine-binding chemotaxis protein CheW